VLLVEMFEPMPSHGKKFCSRVSIRALFQRFGSHTVP